MPGDLSALYFQVKEVMFSLLNVLLLVLIFSMTACLPAAAEPRVVVSLKPVHSLIAGVMDGVATPELLLTGGESPHSYHLRPSQARMLARADVLFWVGPALEGFLVKPLQSLESRTRVVTLMEAPGIHLLPARSGGVWEEHEDHGQSHDHHEAAGKKSPEGKPKRGHDHDHQATDPHLWLDPQNGQAIVRLAAAELARQFPAHQARFVANAEALLVRLAALDDELRRQLSSLRGRPYIVFHDAYQYLEARYGLSAAGAITLSPEVAPGAQRLRAIRQTIRERQAACVFAEPQFEPRLVVTAIEGSGSRQGVLDPLGADLPAGPESYFLLMRHLAKSLQACLEKP